MGKDSFTLNPNGVCVFGSFNNPKSKCFLLLNFSLNAPFVKSVTYLPDLIYFSNSSVEMSPFIRLRTIANWFN